VVQFSNRRLRRADARRVAILRAAARIFRDRGFAAAGMRDIAVAADLSPGNLYHYFKGKDELLYFCQHRTLDRLLAALNDARRGAAPLADRLRALAAAHVLCVIDELQGSAAHFELDALPKRLRAAVVAKRDRYERGVRSLVAEGMRTGQLYAIDAAIATRAFLGALNWTAHWYRPDGSDSPQRVADVVSAFAIAGLSPRAGQPAAGRERNNAERLNHTDRERRTDRGRIRSLQNTARGPA
jgi:AcrR family transcriptional regulator